MIADEARLTPPRCKNHTGSTGQWVHGSTRQRLTFTFTILYMIADDARLMPPRCKKHTAYDDTRLTPHRCKKHTPSFARSTGKFPSLHNTTSLVSVDHAMPCHYLIGMKPNLVISGQCSDLAMLVRGCNYR